jgi:DmsE family decaheme c-type cytochrome
MRYFLSQFRLNDRKILISILALVFLLGMNIDAFAKKKINWAKVNPMLKGAVSIGMSENPDDETECLLCHKDYIKSFGKTKHAKIFVARFGQKLAQSCETCHGPMSKHLEETGINKSSQKVLGKDFKAKYVVSFKKISPKAKNAICLQCHEKSTLMGWKGSAHEMMDVSCNSCHYVSQRKGKKLLISEDPKKGCFQCHREKRAKLLRTSHMPMREGKMDCGSCHNAHGGLGPSLLKRSTTNETCNICHQDKRGPLIWEHAPVREDCSNCHDSHGSNFRPLLKQKLPFLCQQCHMDVFHVSDLFDRRALNSRDPHVAGKSCLNCHSLIHGSNHPSGSRFQR